MKKFQGDSWHLVFQFPNAEANSNSPRAIWSSRRRRGESSGQTWRLILFDVFLFCSHIKFTHLDTFWTCWLDSLMFFRIIWKGWKTWNWSFLKPMLLLQAFFAPVWDSPVVGLDVVFCFQRHGTREVLQIKESIFNQLLLANIMSLMLPRWFSPDCEGKLCIIVHILMYCIEIYTTYDTWIISIISSFTWHMSQDIFDHSRYVDFIHYIIIHYLFCIIYRVYIYIFTFLYIEDFYFRYDNALLCLID